MTYTDFRPVSRRLHSALISLLLVLAFSQHLYAAQPDNTLMLAKTYQGQVLDEQWLWSEKLDGIRGEWNGSRMLTKQGNPIDVPAYFTENFPPFPLSGEIWGGRQTFESTAGIVATSGEDKGWNSLKFGIFDAKDSTQPIEKRINRAREWFAKHPSRYAFVIQQSPVHGEEHLQSLLKEIEAGGGEGIVLIRKGSKYRQGRSVDILKVKNFTDTEGVVIGYVPGKGKHEGRMGSLVVELYQNRNIRFKIGTGFSDQQRSIPPPVGALVTFKHTGFYKSGKPRFPSFIRIRSMSGEML
ncbi:DNA ligase [Desulfosediminicola sp.]|uniref:DNA ligase n=1 Tax=Desulfosediminicola sp. TaxID=2886825 RepID=UPI003AF2DE57